MQNAYKQGFNDGRQGVANNPYDFKTNRVKHCDWQEGYNEGRWQTQVENGRVWGNKLLTK